MTQSFSCVDQQDLATNTQKKSKRKGRNKQEVQAVSQVEPEPEVVKTPIDLMRVSNIVICTHFHHFIFELSVSCAIMPRLWTWSGSPFFICMFPQAQESGGGSSTKKKNKFVNLYNKDGQDRLSVILPGRHSCECLAQKHKLINNCISCGRIVCEQEGSGPCLFCGSLVCKS